MTSDEILSYCLKHLDGTVLVQNWGEKGSNLNREGAYRVNLGLRKATFQRSFGPIPPRPMAGGVVDMPYDFTTLDHLLPHPVYAWMGWISVLNPSEQTFEE